MATSVTYVGRCRHCLAFVAQVPEDRSRLEAVAEAVAAMILADLAVVSLPASEAEHLARAFRRHPEGCQGSPEAVAAGFAKSVAAEHRSTMAALEPAVLCDEAEVASAISPESRQLLQSILQRHGAEFTSFYPADADPVGFPVDRSAR